MYLAYKYLKEKNRKRQQLKATQDTSTATRLYSQDGTVHDTTALAASLDGPNSPISNDTYAIPPPSTTDAQPKEEATPEERAEKKRRRTYRWKIILGLFAPFTLQALDTTIIASALKFIAEDFSPFAPSYPFPFSNPPLPTPAGKEKRKRKKD